jgi:hypothetical protein
MNLLDKFTPQFKAFVAFVLLLAAFALLGFNQILLNKEANQAVLTSNQAYDISTKTFKAVRELNVTPTIEPTATPSALKSTIRISTPASVKK